MTIGMAFIRRPGSYRQHDQRNQSANQIHTRFKRIGEQPNRICEQISACF